jgi:antitoxin HigA-1
MALYKVNFNRPNALGEVHPGEILAEHTFPALGVPIGEIAKYLKLSRQWLYLVMAGKAPITPDMAVRLAKLCGNNAEFWIEMQADHDVWKARRRLAKELETIPTLMPNEAPPLKRRRAGAHQVADLE